MASDPNEPVDLDALDALHAKATPGPWVAEWNDHDDHEAGIDIIQRRGLKGGCRVALVEWDLHEECIRFDAELIAALHNAYPAMAAEIRALRLDLTAIDNAIADRGIAEVSCMLPIAERVSNIISELKDWRHEAATANADVERLTQERDNAESVAVRATLRAEKAEGEAQMLRAEVERLREVADLARQHVMASDHDSECRDDRGCVCGKFELEDAIARARKETP